ncbi:MAG TPA: MerR family transcriptional regulator [Polyangiaceae bacterium]|nr:MerR family transcriptional regulator [Polyangiaceae bacterium]
MPRLRRYRRPDRRRNRVRRPPPQEGFLVRDLARLAGVSVPTIKRYVRHGLLAPVPFYGTATRYPHDYLTRVLALRYWRAQGNKTLAELRRRLDEVTITEMEQWVTSHPLPTETAAALRRERESAPRAESAANAPSAPEALLELPAESWQRWMLMPGLELQLKSDAAPITRQLAARLCRAFASFVSA